MTFEARTPNLFCWMECLNTMSAAMASYMSRSTSKKRCNNKTRITVPSLVTCSLQEADYQLSYNFPL
jgi:hypothetical protein